MTISTIQSSGVDLGLPYDDVSSSVVPILCGKARKLIRNGVTAQILAETTDAMKEPVEDDPA